MLIKTLVQRLVANPHLGKATHVGNARKLVVPRVPYLITHELSEDRDEIVVLRIYHSSRDLPYR